MVLMVLMVLGAHADLGVLVYHLVQGSISPTLAPSLHPYKLLRRTLMAPTGWEAADSVTE